MDKKDFAKKLGVVVGLGLVMVLQSSNAFARDDDRGQRGGERPREVVTVGHQKSSSQESRFFRPSWFWFNRAVFRVVPSVHVVVSQPEVDQNVIVTQNLYGEKVPVNIPNFNGSYSTIMLVRLRDGYLGPQGEYYPGNPTVEQLRSLYGR